MKIGERIALRRKQLGLTQEDLAKKLGYRSKSTINKVELGINDLSQSKVILYANALDVTPGYLMGWEENEPAEEGKLTEKQSELLDLISSLSDSEISVLLAAARSLTELHRSPDDQ